MSLKAQEKRNMSMYSTAERLKKEFEEVFEGSMTYRQLWFIVKVAKGARLYCRSNAAFNNFFGSIFGKVARFEQVEKQKPNGEKYPGLKVTMKQRDGTVISEEGDE